MKHLFTCLVAAVAAASLVGAACAPAAPAPTTAPAAPATSAPAAKPAEAAKTPAEPSRASAAQPTTAPTKKVNFPEKGRAITLTVPYAAGGSVDNSARSLAPVLEASLGTPVQIVNKPGGSTQVGATEVSLAKPDGHTLLYISMPALIVASLDPERKAAYNRKSFEPIAMVTDDTPGLTVKADSPFKALKDLIDAAKARPRQVTVGDAGIMGANHLPVLMLGQQAGVKFASTHFDSGALEMTALLGGHIDAASDMASSSAQHFRAGTTRILGIAASEPSEYLPGAPTLESQGYKIYVGAAQSMLAPAGTPKDVVDMLSQAVKKALDGDEMKTRLKNAVLKPRYMDPAQLAAYWDSMQSSIQPLIAIAREK